MLKKYLSAVEERLAAIIPAEKDPPLCDAMRYSLLAGGKRLRPCMLLAAVEMLGGRWEEAMEYACALEMLHTYSLIHDDLPAMDNDSLRRGRPTNHVVYGEGQAVLAGDGLLNYAYERMLDDAAAHTEAIVQRVQAASEIAQGAGVKYMILGQSLDLASEGKADADETLLGRIHMGKTCGMFRGAMRAAGRFCGADERAMQALTDYAEAFGMLFQYVDETLRVTWMQADTRFIQHVKGTNQATSQGLSQVDSLSLPTRKSRGHSAQCQVTQAHILHKLQA